MIYSFIIIFYLKIYQYNFIIFLLKQIYFRIETETCGANIDVGLFRLSFSPIQSGQRVDRSNLVFKSFVLITTVLLKIQSSSREEVHDVGRIKSSIKLKGAWVYLGRFHRVDPV